MGPSSLRRFCQDYIIATRGYSFREGQDFAACMHELTDVHYPRAERIRVVLDNLSTHSPGALYQTFGINWMFTTEKTRAKMGAPTQSPRAHQATGKEPNPP